MNIDATLLNLRKKFYLSIESHICQSILAGICIALGCIAMNVVKSDLSFSPATSAIVSGFAFTIGLFGIVTASGQLFTGNCLLLISVLKRDSSVKDFFAFLLIDFVFNFIGIAITAFIFCNSGIHTDALVELATSKMIKNPVQLIFSAFMCNICVCLAVYISQKSQTVVDRFVAVCLPVMIFIMCGFEHSIADMFFCFFADGQPIIQRITFVFLVAMGNLFGGFIFSTLIYKAHYEKV